MAPRQTDEFGRVVGNVTGESGMGHRAVETVGGGAPSPAGAIIHADGLSRTFRLPKRREGFKGALRDLLHPEYRTVHAVREVCFDVPRGQKLDASLSTQVFQSLFHGNGVEVLRALGDEAYRRALGPVSRAEAALQKLERGEIHVVAEMSVAQRAQYKRLERETRGVSRSVFFGSVLIASTILYTSGEVTLALAGYGVCALTFVVGLLRD